MSFAQRTAENKNKESIFKSFWKVINPVLKFGITFGILWYLYSKGMLDFSRVKNVILDYPVFIFMFGIQVLCMLGGVRRWQWLLKGQQLPLPFREALDLTMIGVFFNTAIPGAVSGDFVKGFYVVQKQPDGRGRIRAFTTLLLDRILGLSALVFVSFFAMLFNFSEITSNPSLKHLAGMISLIWLGVVVFYLFVLIKSPITQWIQSILTKLPMGELFLKLFEAVKAYEDRREYLLKGFLVSVAIHLTIISGFYFLSRSLGGFEQVPLLKFYFLVPFGMLVTAIPIAPAGLGTGHAAFLWLFQLAGSPGGADLFTAYVSFQILLSLVGGIFYIRYRGTHPKLVVKD